MERRQIMDTTELPEQDPEQTSLPFSDRDEAPIEFSLTARARRAVAPDSLPPLEVVPDDDRDGTYVEDPADTRPARARALRRAGLSVAAVAAEIEVDEVLARAWCGDVVGRPRGGRKRVAALAAAPATQGPEQPLVTAALRRFEERREAAREEVGPLLAGDVGFARGLGLVAGLVEITPHAATVATRDPKVGAAVVRWLRHHAGVDENRLRVVLQLGPDVPGDAASHEWRSLLGLPSVRVSQTRWRFAPTPDTVQALIRIADPELAGRLAGWRDELLAVTSGNVVGAG